MMKRFVTKSSFFRNMFATSRPKASSTSPPEKTHDAKDAKDRSAQSGPFRGMFDDLRGMFDDFEEAFDDADAAFVASAREADQIDQTDPPKDGETVTTRREETRPDGTRVVTTVTRSRR